MKHTANNDSVDTLKYQAINNKDFLSLLLCISK